MAFLRFCNRVGVMTYVDEFRDGHLARGLAVLARLEGDEHEAAARTAAAGVASDGGDRRIAADDVDQLLHLGLHRIEINIRPENAASIRVAEKAGYTFESDRPVFLHIAGAWRDHKSFVKINDLVK